MINAAWGSSQYQVWNCSSTKWGWSQYRGDRWLDDAAVPVISALALTNPVDQFDIGHFGFEAANVATPALTGGDIYPDGPGAGCPYRRDQESVIATFASEQQDLWDPVGGRT